MTNGEYIKENFRYEKSTGEVLRRRNPDCKDPSCYPSHPGCWETYGNTGDMNVWVRGEMRTIMQLLLPDKEEDFLPIPPPPLNYTGPWDKNRSVGGSV